MSQKTPKRFETVSYRNAAGKSYDVVVDNLQEPAPPVADITIQTAASGGTLAAATYTYRVSAVIAGTETTASTGKAQATTGSTSTVTINWAAVYAKRPWNAATSFKVYGRTGGSELLMATVAVGTALQFVDDGSVTPSGALPATSSAIDFKNRSTKSSHTGIAPATAVKQTNVYYNY